MRMSAIAVNSAESTARVITALYQDDDASILMSLTND